MTESLTPGPRQPADQSQRDAALEIGHSFIVQAPAGSGKTELLTQRMLKLLGRVERPERVLAITFTRKATQEMRERIMRRVRQAHEGERPEPHEAAAVRLAREVLKNAETRGWDLLEHPGRLRILTIDALCANLLQRSPEHGAAATGLRLLEDARPLYRHAVRRLFEDLDEPEVIKGRALEGGARLHDALVRVLTHLDGDVQRLEDLLIDMLAIRDQWVDPAAPDGRGRPRANLTEVLRDRQIAEAETFRGDLGPANVERALALATELGGEVDPDHDDAVPARRLRELGDSSDAETTVWKMHWLGQLLTTKNAKPRGRKAIAPRLFKGAGENVRAHIDELSEIYQRWHENPDALQAIERMARHPPLQHGGEAGGFSDIVLEDVVALLQLLLAELLVVMGEQGATDFQHLAQAALQCLEPDTDGTVSPLLLAEDLRLEHMLVDEFQDTSHAQHRLIRRLTEGWQPGDGRTVFLVGDPMQSIYRFRQADVGLFTAVVRERRMGDVPLDVLHLTANFRSRAEIVDWANARFRDIFPTEDRRDSGAVAYHAAVAERDPGGQVRLHPLAPLSPPEDEAREIVELIRSCRLRLDEPEIAVLVRARTHLLALARELNSQGIDYEAVQIDPLAGRPAIQDLCALTRVLVQPADRVAWLALLRAPWCALTVPALHRVAGEARDADMLARVFDAADEAGLATADRQRLRRLQVELTWAFGTAADRSVAARVERVWLQLGGPRCYAGPEELENAAAFLGLLDTLERESPLELIERLNEAMAELYARGRSSKIKLMTIHKAKGLEFDIVILPGMHRSGRRGDSRLVMAQSFALHGRLPDASPEMSPGEDGDGLLMAAITSKRHTGPSVYDYLSAVDRERERYEQQRLLYVAATRAKTELHLFGRFGWTRKGNFTIPAGSFMKLLEPVFMTAAEALDYEPGSEQRIAPDVPVMPLLRLRELHEGTAQAADPQATTEPAELPQLADPAATAMGDALHRILELMVDHARPEDAINWAKSISGNEEVMNSLLRRGGANEDALDDRRVQLRELIEKTMESGAGAALLTRRGAQATLAELPLLSRAGDRIEQHYIDLAWQDEQGDWHVVDYKTGADTPETREAWRAQLERYAALMEQLTGASPASLSISQAESGNVLYFTRNGLEAT